ncbi:MAG: ABC transporter permease [candidate division WOR-3 bacterium]|nr:ABC transporter permease [candidate division WOR-3 bacterium]MCX7947084.1 ABC transporter permease [candidate division WOR-3 bacterium]MDW8149875.1 FtsX-like permease family protein [candidate division WOR-3 bacterium]
MNIYILLVLRFFKTTRKGILSFLSIFSIVGIMLGVSALLVVIGIMNGFRSEIENRLLRFTPHISIIPNRILDYSEIEEKLRRFQEIREIKRFTIIKTVVRSHDKMDGVVLKVVDSPYKELKEAVISGSLNIEDGVVLGKGLAQKLNILDGDSIDIFFGMNLIPIKLRVNGIVDAGIYDINEHFVLTSFKTLEKLIDFEISGIEVYLYRPSNTTSLANLLRKDLENMHIYTWIDLNRNLFSALELEKLGMFLVLLLITIVASFNIISTLSIMSQQKAYDIAILKVFGFKSKDIMIVFLMLGILIGLIGIVLGNFLGFILSFLITDLKLIKLQPEIYFIDYIPIKTSIMDYLIISGFAFFIVLSFSILTSLNISRMNILDGLKRI